MAWWRHNCDTLHVMKIYFIELHVKIKYVKSEEKILIKTYVNIKDFLPDDY